MANEIRRYKKRKTSQELKKSSKISNLRRNDMVDKISISKFSSNYKDDGIEIQIEDENYNVLYKGEISFDEFAKCITGQHCCEIKRTFKEV